MLGRSWRVLMKFEVRGPKGPPERGPRKGSGLKEVGNRRQRIGVHRERKLEYGSGDVGRDLEN